MVGTRTDTAPATAQSNFGTVAQFVGNQCENSGLTAESGTMSFSL
jgi:hypothetical protein